MITLAIQDDMRDTSIEIVKYLYTAAENEAAGKVGILVVQKCKGSFNHYKKSANASDKSWSDSNWNCKMMVMKRSLGANA